MKTQDEFSDVRSPGQAPGLPEEEGRNRVVIEGVSPEIDAGRYPIKRVLGEKVVVAADIFGDGHDHLSARVKFRHASASHWSEAPMTAGVNDRWTGEFEVSELGTYLYTVEAWVDAFETWRHDLRKRLQAGQDVAVELLEGARLVEEAAATAVGEQARLLQAWLGEFGNADQPPASPRAQRALDEEMAAVMRLCAVKRFVTRYGRELKATVDPVLARFSAWYEMFPRSCPGRKGPHGTFRDVEGHLAHVAAMGFDVLYFPPIHPIGYTFRKGKNNNPSRQPGEPGSPWGIGAEIGGHKSVHPELGALEDFRRLTRNARELGIEVALDIAYQCSPDHPYVSEHAEWFRKRADGSIRCAENPPKKYQDIYPFDFETEAWRELWQELKSVLEFWAEQGVRVFRVDNPHTKPFRFWEWAIEELKAARPELLLLSEAFTRPKPMYALAKLGFGQSYNYFPWRNSKTELVEYLTELTRTEVAEFFRPNFWPNTPDILTPYLQYGGRPAFVIRLILAATLAASYGIYGPPFELCVQQAREVGSEEYLDSEKYEIKTWDLNQPGNLIETISRVNRIRRENPALQSNERLEFHAIDNDELLAYSKTTADLENIILVVVNLDPHHRQTGWINLSLDALGLEPDSPCQVNDLLSDARFLWHGARNFIALDPADWPAHVFKVRRRLRSERDFEEFH